MKLKISFDKKAIGNFFLEHTEKVVFGIFIIVFAGVIYGAIWNREKFDKSPKLLSDQCDNAQRSLQGERKISLETDDYIKKVEKIKNNKDIIAAPYESVVALDRPVFGQKSQRDKPEIFNVEDLRAAADFGAFQINPAAAGEGAGRGPAARPGGRNAPAAAAAGSGSIGGKCWVVLTGLLPNEDQSNAYKKAFRDAITYDPSKDVPTYADYVVDRAEINSPADEQNPKWNKQVSFNNAHKEALKEWTPQSQAEVVQIEYLDSILTFPLGPMQNRSWGKNVAHEPEIPALRSGSDTSGEIKSAKYKLFRYFDFFVEPGKSYIYRVRLVLSNPNYKLPPSQLKDPSFAEKEFLETDWSARSKVIEVPNDTKILAKSVKPKTGGDPSGKVLLVKWVKETGQEISKEASVERGQVLNVKSDGDNPDFTTDNTVLDMDGGRKLIGKDRNLPPEPGEMLLMFARGNKLILTIRNELDDMAEANQKTATETETPKAPVRGPGARGADAENVLLGPGGDNTQRRPPPPRPR